MILPGGCPQQAYRREIPIGSGIYFLLPGGPPQQVLLRKTPVGSGIYFFCPAALHSKPSPMNLSLENTSRFIRPPASLQFMSYMFCLRNVNTLSQFSPPVVTTHSLRKLNRSHTRLNFRLIGRASHCALSMHDGRVPGSPHLCVIRPHSRCEAWVLNMMKPVGVLGTGHVQSS